MNEESLKERLQYQISQSELIGEPTDQTSWGYEQGVLITVDEAKYLLNILKERK